MMTVAPETAAMNRAALDPEWLRVDLLLQMAEAARAGTPLPADFAGRLAASTAEAEDGRDSGAWHGLRRIVPDALLEQFLQIDLDILALALAPEVWPSSAPRVQSLQPHIGTPQPSLALIHELLGLGSGSEIGTLLSRLDPHAPLIAADLVRVSGNGAYQTVTATRPLLRAVFGRTTDLSPPPGAHLVRVSADWSGLVLPETSLAHLRDFTAWIRVRDQVIADWGARPLGGPLALFCGPSGSGKSFAAGIIAARLTEETGEDWALYALDLGRIMSKYIGETEQNLNALLDALDGRRAILQIDEADGLLGKRGEVTEARDRYANLEVSHMLARFERHAGPVILTTNLRTNIDSAFLRRFQQIVDFPAPDTTARRILWEKLLPAAAPRDESLDTDELAAAVRLSGGAIHNAAFFAAVIARDRDEPIGPRHIARAVWAELNKDNRQVRRSELGPLAVHLEDAP